MPKAGSKLPRPIAEALVLRPCPDLPGRPSPPHPCPSVPRPGAVDELRGAAVAAAAGMRDGQSPSLPGALNVAPGARCLALPCRAQRGMEGPQRVVALGGPCMVAWLLPSHPSPRPLPANAALQISIFMK